jgi:acyl-CoA synthetase (AMP-forming)/AMP-acid ligase II
MWLPLYHDMGLIGGIFNNVYRGGTCHLMSPVDFLRQPRRWVELLSATGAVYTGAPNFAYELAARKTPDAVRAALDLSKLAVACTGAEPVRAEALDRFADAFAVAGFRADRFMACYGLAEATLFVAGSRRGAVPARVTLDARALARGEIAQASSGRTLVGHGAAPPGHRVVIVDPAARTVLGPDRLGEVWVATPGVSAGYLGREAETTEAFGARLEGGGGPFSCAPAIRASSTRASCT